MRRRLRAARALLEDEANELLFSAASLWEVAIKQQLGRKGFRADARLLDNGNAELPVTSAHAVGLDMPPPLHKDPFDRMLIAQALVEGVMVLTAYANLTRYPGLIQAI